MIIPPTNRGQVPPDGPDPRKPAAAAVSPAATDRISLHQNAQFIATLKQLPAVRPEVIARGRELAADSNYPPRAIIDQIAKLITASQDFSLEA